MEDFTGGIAYSTRVSSSTPRVLWRSLTAALSRGSLLSCFIEVNTHTHSHSHEQRHATAAEADFQGSLSSQAGSYQEVGEVTGEGLVKGHAYAITDTEKVSVSHRGLCRLPFRDMPSLC